MQQQNPILERKSTRFADPSECISAIERGRFCREAEYLGLSFEIVQAAGNKVRRVDNESPKERIVRVNLRVRLCASSYVKTCDYLYLCLARALCSYLVSLAVPQLSEVLYCKSDKNTSGENSVKSVTSSVITNRSNFPSSLAKRAFQGLHDIFSRRAQLFTVRPVRFKVAV
ncbi:hypothetical protein OS493_001280 [Desmophyllum pertusum]|uniref:Uncharacterized protein n=1 Tax=Desmophyllum pertusum TaxID=174260 RepID=A0A9X0D704_9CNID|nr:hypothetical protein OS493_001280 [Desmophyllum pertusum]